MRGRTRQIVQLAVGLILIVAVLVILNLLVAPPGKSRRDSGMPTGSTYSTASDGAELLYRLFDELGFEVERLRRPLDGAFLDGDEVDVIWHAWGRGQVGNEEVEWVERWVSDGGTLVLIDDPRFSGQLEPARPPPALGFSDRLIEYWMEHLEMRGRLREVARIGGTAGPHAIPNRVQVGARRMGTALGEIEMISTYQRRGLVGFEVYRFVRSEDTWPDRHAVIKDGYGMVVVKIHHGRGQVWLIADPYLFGNMLIQEAGNGPMAAGIVLDSRGGEYSRVVFDEYHLGFVQTVSFMDAARTPVGMGLLFLGAVAALAVGTAGARFGRVRRAPGAIGVSQRAFVQALAGLWQGAGATSAAADALWRRYRGRRSTRRRGLDRELDAMRKGRPRVDDLVEVARKLDA